MWWKKEHKPVWVRRRSRRGRRRESRRRRRRKQPWISLSKLLPPFRTNTLTINEANLRVVEVFNSFHSSPRATSLTRVPVADRFHVLVAFLNTPSWISILKRDFLLVGWNLPGVIRMVACWRDMLRSFPKLMWGLAPLPRMNSPMGKYHVDGFSLVFGVLVSWNIGNGSRWKDIVAGRRTQLWEFLPPST